ncbi:hypothetical protein K439DRAFT_810335 [Ramaria rubella]|nr:hypothetical protein K439DRAFT_810335 [Ramaria rubella]
MNSFPIGRSSCCSLFLDWKFTSYSVGIEDQTYLLALNHPAWEPEDVYLTPEINNRGPGDLPIQFTGNFHDYRHHIHSCPANDCFQSGSPTIQLDKLHSYRRLPPTGQKATDRVFGDVAPVHRPQSQSDGPVRPAKRGVPAKFECVACKVQFAYESSAKRHQENQVKRFQCEVCHHKFARSDYRDWHQRRCIDALRS